MLKTTFFRRGFIEPATLITFSLLTAAIIGTYIAGRALNQNTEDRSRALITAPCRVCSGGLCVRSSNVSCNLEFDECVTSANCPQPSQPPPPPPTNPPPSNNCDENGGKCVPSNYVCTPSGTINKTCDSGLKCVGESATCHLPVTATPIPPTQVPFPTNTTAPTKYACTANYQCTLSSSGIYPNIGECQIACVPSPTPTPIPIKSPTPTQISTACEAHAGKCVPNVYSCTPATLINRTCQAGYKCVGEAAACIVPSPTPVPTIACSGTCLPNGEECTINGTGYCSGNAFCCAVVPTNAPVTYPTPLNSCENAGGILCSRNSSTCRNNSEMSAYSSITDLCCSSGCTTLAATITPAPTLRQCGEAGTYCGYSGSQCCTGFTCENTTAKHECRADDNTLCRLDSHCLTSSFCDFIPERIAADGEYIGKCQAKRPDGSECGPMKAAACVSGNCDTYFIDARKPSGTCIPARSPGRTCTNNTQCTTGFCNPTSKACEARKADGEQCAIPEECINGFCGGEVDNIYAQHTCKSSALGSSCDYNSDCPMPLYCKKDRSNHPRMCDIPFQDYINTCTSPNECETGICGPNGVCHENYCTNQGGSCLTQPCCHGLACTPSGSCKIKSYLSEFAASITCSNNAECASGWCDTVNTQRCQDKKPLGATCNSKLECGSNLCTNGKCTSTNFGGACQNDTECSFGYCLELGEHTDPNSQGQSWNKECRLPLNNGSQCDRSNQCLSGYCRQGMCDIPAPASCSGYGDSCKVSTLVECANSYGSGKQLCDYTFCTATNVCGGSPTNCGDCLYTNIKTPLPTSTTPQPIIGPVTPERMAIYLQDDQWSYIQAYCRLSNTSEYEWYTFDKDSIPTNITHCTDGILNTGENGRG
jgi:hypothetical protein